MLAFPLPAAAFFNLLPIAQITFDLPETVSHSRTRGGDVLSADIGDRLWTGEVTLGKITHEEYADVRPLIDLLRGAGTSFEIHDPTRPYPRGDLGGATLGASTPGIAALLNARELTITGLPPGYVISRDDMIGFQYAAAPRRYALHQVVTGAVANGVGTTPAIEVIPPIAPGVTVGEAVTLVRPPCKAMILPNSTAPAKARAIIRDGATFRWRQTFR